MGCNYYLKYKVNNLDEYFNVTGTLADQDYCTEDYGIMELTNGYVIYNTYYKSLDEFSGLELDLHIGKSSFG